MNILDQAIPNMAFPFEGVSRTIEIFELNINSDVKQFFVNYRINSVKDDIDVSDKIVSKKRDWYIGNEKNVYKRSLPDFQPIQNPNFVSKEETPDETEFLEAPAFDYLLEVFKEHPELIFDILKGYILENYADGWFD